MYNKSEGEIKMKKILKWLVYRGDFNSKTIEEFNVFDHISFNKGVYAAEKKFKNDFEGFSKEVKSLLMYYFWSKCEYEVVITEWPPAFVFYNGAESAEKTPSGLLDGVRLRSGIKIDIYDQIKLNWDAFINYLWSSLNAPDRKTSKNTLKKESKEEIK